MTPLALAGRALCGHAGSARLAAQVVLRNDEWTKQFRYYLLGSPAADDNAAGEPSR